MLWSRYGLVALGVGALVAVQSRMNGGLALAVGDPFAAAWWNFLSGCVGMSVILLCSPTARSGLAKLPAALTGESPPRLQKWHLLGGVSGGLFICVQAFAAPVLGVAAFLVAVVAGQVSSALLIDRVGLGPSGVQRVTPSRIVAAVLATVGVVLAVVERVEFGGRAIVIPVILAFLVGGVTMIQVAINGRVNVATGVPAATTWVNFTVGALTTTVLWLALSDRWPDLSQWEWWMLGGGICGMIYVSLLAVLVRHLGVLWTLIATLIGQLGGGLVLDLFNPAVNGLVTPLVILGLLVTLAAAGLGNLQAAARPKPVVG